MTEINSHYKVGGIQPIEYMKCKMTKEQYEGFCLGNVIKYISRCDYKSSKIEDLKKASEYLKWLIESVESANLMGNLSDSDAKRIYDNMR